MHGQFSWYDLMTPDVAASKKFYPGVTAWRTEEWDVAEYTMWTAAGVPFAGMNPISPEQRAQGVPSHWLGYVTVDSVENAASTVTSLGGKVMHGPEDIPNVGRFAIIQDPQGAMLSIFKSNTPSPGFDGTPKLGLFTWHELMTTDVNSAFAFYRQVFGWERVRELDMGPAGKYLEFGIGGKSFGGIYPRDAERAQVAPNWLYYANVRDVHKAATAAKKAGGTIKVGPTEVPGGDWVVVVTDTLGAPFALHQSRASVATSKPGAKPKTSGKKPAKVKAKAAARKPARAKGKVAARKPAKTKSKAKSGAKGKPRRKTAKKAKRS
jgi:predicted enzyme related to lactoylglutathione lyase